MLVVSYAGQSWLLQEENNVIVKSAKSTAIKIRFFITVFFYQLFQR